MRNTHIILWLLYFAFLGRVLGQAMVGLNLAPQLPAFEQWQSGILPYPALVATQILILIAFAKIARDLTIKRGYFATHHPRLGKNLRLLAIAYLALMTIRYAVTHFLAPSLAHLAPLIPTFFHFVLAFFILFTGNALCTEPPESKQQEPI